jgi:predicted nucleic acid-binding protein
VSLVLDSFVTLAWLYSDEGGAAVDSVFSRIVGARTWVPALWRLEVANSLPVAVRRGRVTEQFGDHSLDDLSRLEIVADQETDKHAWCTTMRLADRLKLTLYDAAYLELAQRMGLPLATLDEDLRQAADLLGVPLLGLSSDEAAAG